MALLDSVKDAVTERLEVFTGAQFQPAIISRGSVVAGVTVTVKESESHTYTSNISNFSLETGAVVSEHVILQPEKVSVVVGVTNTSQDFAAFDQFVEMWEKREPVELITEHKIYTDMVLTEFTPTHAAPYRGAWTANCVFQKVHFVELHVIGKREGKTAGVAKKTAVGKTQGGNVAPADDNTSWLKQTKGKLSGSMSSASKSVDDWFNSL